MNHIPVKIWTEFAHNHGLPKYETAGAAGMDVRANSRVVIHPKETKLIPTGIFVQIPEGYEIQVRPRSGMSLKTSFRVANSPGTVDSDYRGELCVIGENTNGSVDFVVELGERIGQLVLNRVPQIVWDPVMSKEELTDTDRGIGGFGSSGQK